MIIKSGPSYIMIFLTSTITFLSGCTTSAESTNPASTETPDILQACPVRQPLWVKPPDDPAVDGEPGYGYYYVNEDGALWASAWWQESDEYHLVAGDAGNKVGWFRPAGEDLIITGKRLDAPASPLETDIPCCYPTRFQATGLIFPTQGCWEVTATAAGSELKFVVYVSP